MTALSMATTAATEGTGAPLWAWGFVVFVVWFATQVLNFNKPMNGATVLIGFAVVGAVIWWAARLPPPT